MSYLHSFTLGTLSDTAHYQMPAWHEPPTAALQAMPGYGEPTGVTPARGAAGLPIDGWQKLALHLLYAAQLEEIRRLGT